MWRDPQHGTMPVGDAYLGVVGNLGRSTVDWGAEDSGGVDKRELGASSLGVWALGAISKASGSLGMVSGLASW